MSSCNPAVPFWELIALEEIASNATGKSLSEFFGFHDSQDSVYGPLGASSELSPAADVFDTATSYVIHISLPGAKKEDIWIGFDEQKSEIQISGVVYRNGDEELLKTLTVGERGSGFLRRRSPKLKDGILEVLVPKKERESFESRKVLIN
ncbi:uncharacterized protein LAJ45_02256 [Morchella importuna]|uniref:uncharacterized protein n=1 Tax=Morchella importuna TaxID=1174673 RepID=UPI001E8DE337|nr:uncharacterized protein LAJ45_02256 [Morchella importuna]KAH8153443.1 hypothetical protein LAJ45_02256 [Morchella importuna]